MKELLFIYQFYKIYIYFKTLTITTNFFHLAKINFITEIYEFPSPCDISAEQNLLHPFVITSNKASLEFFKDDKYKF